MRSRRLLVIAAVAGMLFGCGQKGPLLLPEAEHPRKKVGLPKPPTAPAPAPATQPSTAPTAPAGP